jgi:hypothetical protein
MGYFSISMQNIIPVMHYWSKVALASIAFLALASSLQIASAASKLSFVTVQTEGSGPTFKRAVLDGLKMALSQVNGAAVAASTTTSISSSSSGTGESKEYVYSNDFRQHIETATKGVVKSWDVISERKDPNLGNMIFLQMKVTVAKYKESPQLQRLRLAFSNFNVVSTGGDGRLKEQTANKIQQRITNYLTQTRRFAILDRQKMQQTNMELALIQGADFKVEEMARLGNKVGADYMVLGSLDVARTYKTEQVMQSTGKRFINSISELSYSIQIIDIATSQIKYSDTFELSDETSLAMLAKDSSREAGEAILNAIFPIRVLAVQNDMITFGQGGKTVQKNRSYNLVKLGEKLYDPYTKESLGRNEIIIGEVNVTNVQAKTATAKITKLNGVTLDKLSTLALIARPTIMGERRSSSAMKKEKLQKTVKQGQEAVNKLKKEAESAW